jgi:hypothetical protein
VSRDKFTGKLWRGLFLSCYCDMFKTSQPSATVLTQLSCLFWGLFVFAVLGFEFRALHLQGRHSITWAISPAFFASVILGIGSHIYAPTGLDNDSSVYAYHITGMTHVCHHNHLVVQMGSHELFALAGLKLQLSQSPPLE